MWEAVKRRRSCINTAAGRKQPNKQLDLFHICDIPSASRRIMDASSSSSRPRQRTFTSCTECRRRKQKCNQAKSPRKCSNCERRWPPVQCTYSESSSPPPPSYGRYDLREDTGLRPGAGSYAHSQPSYAHSTTITSPSDTSSYHVSTANYYDSIPTPGSYPSPSTRSDYDTYSSSHDASPHSRGLQYSSVPSSEGYATTTDAAYYSNGSQLDYSSAGGAPSGYYPTTDYYTTTGDPGAFVGATPEYYYVEPDLSNMPSTTRSS